MDRRPGTGCGRRAESRRRWPWRDEGDRSGEQRLRVPGCRAWRDRRGDARDHRRDVPGRRPRAGWSRISRPIADGRASTRPSQACGPSRGRSQSRSPARRGIAGMGGIAPISRSRRRSTLRCGGLTTCRWSPAADRTETAAPWVCRRRRAIHRPPTRPGAQTRSNAIATDPPPPRQRVASPYCPPRRWSS